MPNADHNYSTCAIWPKCQEVPGGEDALLRVLELQPSILQMIHKYLCRFLI